MLIYPLCVNIMRHTYFWPLSLAYASDRSETERLHLSVTCRSTGKAKIFSCSSGVGYRIDDEHSHVHGVLTSDNLFDGTVVTNLEQYYIEPAARYSPELERRHGVHTVIYKLSDVKIHQNHHGHHRPLRADAQNGSREQQPSAPNGQGAASGERMLNLAKNQSRLEFNLNPGAVRSAPMDSSEAEAKQRRTGTATRKTRRKRRWLEEEEVPFNIIESSSKGLRREKFNERSVQSAIFT
uniref:Uncharacterized protein n=1 Tax=Anopheles maculatus TaxID=74869 RepID=A0A182T0R1_9DIPT